MIVRIWHGYTTPENAEPYESLLRAVQSGLLIYEIRPWLTAMEHEWRKP